MDNSLAAVLLILAVGFGVAIAGGLLLHRVSVRRTRGSDADQDLGADGVSAATSFVGGAAAFLLGVLMLSALDHYNATKDVVSQEAVAFSQAFQYTDGLAPADEQTIQRDLICLMRSVATYSWTAAEAGNLNGSDNTHAWQRRTTMHANAAVTTTKAQEDSLGGVKSNLISAIGSGQQRLLAAHSNLPLALRNLVFVSILVLTAMLTAQLRGHPSRAFAISALASVLIVSTAMIATLKTFDEPFTQGDGVYIAPRALNAALSRLEATYPGADWRECEMLARP